MYVIRLLRGKKDYMIICLYNVRTYRTAEADCQILCNSLAVLQIDEPQVAETLEVQISQFH